MIPRRIVLQNFRAIAETDIDLTDVTIAAIIGPNGVGKSSTFTLAPVFALFGDKIKGISMDDLVLRGAQEMAVTFEFEHHGSIYQVIRTRSTKGKGKSTLELQRLVNGKWEGQSAEKISDTEAKIRELLNLDLETFTASSMILQGKANEFTAQTAGKRKEILQQVLGLSIYDRLQEAARVKAANLNLEIEKSKAKLAELNARLQDKPLKEEALAQLELELKSTREAITTSESELRKQEETVRDLESKAAKAAELEKQMVILADEINALATEKTNLSSRSIRAEKILANEADILAKSEELQKVREQIVALEARQPELKRYHEELLDIDTSIIELQNQQGPIEHRIGNIQQVLLNKELILEKEAEYKAATADLERIEAVATQWDILEKEIAEIRAKHGAEEMRINTTEQLLSTEIKALEAKTAMLEDSNCIDVGQAACRFLSDAQEARKLLAGKRADIAGIDYTNFHSLMETLENLISNQQSLGYDYLAHRALKVRVDELRPLAEQAALIQANEELVCSLQEQKERLISRETELTHKQQVIKNNLMQLQQALAPLSGFRERAGKLQQWAVLKDELAVARETKRNTEERINAIEREIERKSTHRNELDLEISGLLLDAVGLPDALAKVPELQSQLKQYREKETVLVGRIGGLQAEISALEKNEQERARLSAELDPKSKEWARYQTLIRAFGKDGIPALIIENAVPELERIANDILGQMSKERHYVRFETQRELKSKDGMAETLDIIIGDWSSERPYETFSGGEQLRIDYAIRFALAELLARRAGSKVEWLTIDEGLGSQDSEHRALVLESIKSVADRFKKVLVITHIEDAQAVFDQQIILENTGDRVDVKVA